MPEIKHTFTGGKMNKDIDERLVPNGEYRDAMNIQVATSEESDVATAQNILGNYRLRIKTNTGLVELPSEAATVATIPDEINDKLYYFIWTKNTNYIVEYSDGNPNANIVFIDDKTRFDDEGEPIASVLKFSPDNIITGINVIDNMIFWTDNQSEPKKINIQRSREGTQYPNHTKVINEKANITLGTSIDIEEKHVTVIKKSPPTPLKMELETNRIVGKNYTAVVDISIDESLAEDLVERIDVDGNVDSTFYDFNSVAVDELITLDINKYLSSGGDVVTGQDLSDMTGWGDLSDSPKVVLQAFDEDGEAPSTPITNFTIRGIIVDSDLSASTITIRVNSIDGFPDTPNVGEEILQYAVDLFQEEDKLFEFKFPRFSYRYKYEDGEYTPFAPFTQVAFVPGSFDYHPRKGYNLGMINRLTKINLGNIVTEKTPKDVVSIDILFKEEPSPNIYIIDTIKPNDDFESSTSTTNVWNRLKDNPNEEYFQITKETVNSTLPSNQLLRPWDNVPRKALSQEITASRVIYGNYVQNYDLISSTDETKKYVPSFDFTLVDRTSDIVEYTRTKKSIKSLREYQLGVVFLDKYGRETPVISNTSGTYRVPKEEANKSKAITTRLKGGFPKDLTHFKIFVKETSGEYYNMAMDRWYNAEDDNIWLAFPSSDRNKVDIDTFLILKKGTDSDTLIEDQARYKVIAIENEAPDFIKTSRDIASRVLNSGQAIFGSNTTDAPVENQKEFKMRYEPFYGTPGQNLHEINDSELYVEFAKGSQVSDRYKIISITCDFDPVNGPQASGAFYNVRLEKSLKSDVNFITNDPLGVNVTEIDSKTAVNVYTYKVESKPQFDGRFFVKIYYDEVFRRNIVKSTDEELGVKVASEKRIYGMFRAEKHNDLHCGNVSRFATDGRSVTNESAFMGSLYVDYSYQAGYYLIDEFTRMALYFRRYKKFGDANGTGYGNDLFGSNRYRMLHLGKGSSVDHVVAYDESHGVGEYWSYAGDLVTPTVYSHDWGKHYERWGEFGITKDGNDARAEITNDDEYMSTGDAYILVGGPGSGTAWMSLASDGYPGALTANWGDDPNFPQEGNKGKWDALLSSDRTVARDTEVWFVDQGPYLTEEISHDLDWNGGTADHDTRSFVNGQGIVVQGNTFDMELAFGGITTQKDVSINVKAGGNAVGATNIWENHFNVGGWNATGYMGVNATYNTSTDRDFISQINTSSRFRIKEDPNETIYTIQGNISSRGKFRHSNYAHWGDNEEEVENTQDNGQSMAEQLSFNFTKNWKIENIQGPSGSSDLFAKHIMKLGRLPSGVSPRVELAVCDMSGDVTGPNTTSGLTIDTDLKIYVKTIEDVDGNFLHEGMALYKYEAVGQTQTQTLPTYFGSPVGFGKNEYLVVRRIIEKGNVTDRYYELILGGYEFPLSVTEHLHINVNNKPKPETYYTFAQVGMNGYSHNSEFNINTMAHKNTGKGRVGAVGYTLQWVEDVEPEETLSENPAIFETEPKEIKELDIYHEATAALPIKLNSDTVQDAFPLGSYFTIPTIGISNPYTTPTRYEVYGYSQDKVVVSTLTPLLNHNFSPAVNVDVHRPDNLVIRATIYLTLV